MCGVMWNLFPILKNGWSIQNSTFPETSYWNIDRCKLESSQKMKAEPSRPIPQKLANLELLMGIGLVFNEDWYKRETWAYFSK